MKALGILTLLAACHGFDPPGQLAESPHPLSNAGTGSFYPLGTSVTLDGSRSSAADGKPSRTAGRSCNSPLEALRCPSIQAPRRPRSCSISSAPFWFRLDVSDDAGNTDSSDLRIVSTGAVTAIDAGSNATVSWLDTVHLAGTVSTAPGKTATYSWSFYRSRPVRRPMIQNGDDARSDVLCRCGG